LTCTDEALWSELTRESPVTPDVHLLCLNAMCDNDVKCAKECLGHITKQVDPDDIQRWQQCTYSSGCAGVTGYSQREACADKCLQVKRFFTYSCPKADFLG
jgi:hypothetical protein